MSVYHNCLSFLLISAPPLSRLVHITHRKTTPSYCYFDSHITHHKTPPHDCYFYSHITRHHLIIILSTHYTTLIVYILPHKYLHKMNSKRENVHIRSCGIVKTCSPLKTDFSKFHYIAFLSNSLVPSLDGAGSVNVNARNLPSDEVCKESLISSAA